MRRTRATEINGVRSRYKEKENKKGMTLTSAFYDTDMFEVWRVVDWDIVHDELIQQYLSNQVYELNGVQLRKFEKGFSVFIDFIRK